MANFKCEKKSEYLSEEDFKKRENYWNKKQFRVWTKKEMARDSVKMQKLLVALSKFSLAEIQEIRKSKTKGPFKEDAYKLEVFWAREKDFDYAMSIAPKTFFKTECPNR